MLLCIVRVAPPVYNLDQIVSIKPHYNSRMISYLRVQVLLLLDPIQRSEFPCLASGIDEHIVSNDAAVNNSR